MLDVLSLPAGQFTMYSRLQCDCQMGSRRMLPACKQMTPTHLPGASSDYVCSEMCDSTNPFCHHHVNRPRPLRP